MPHRKTHRSPHRRIDAAANDTLRIDIHYSLNPHPLARKFTKPPPHPFALHPIPLSLSLCAFSLCAITSTKSQQTESRLPGFLPCRMPPLGRPKDAHTRDHEHSLALWRFGAICTRRPHMTHTKKDEPSKSKVSCHAHCTAHATLQLFHTDKPPVRPTLCQRNPPGHYHIAGKRRV